MYINRIEEKESIFKKLYYGKTKKLTKLKVFFTISTKVVEFSY